DQPRLDELQGQRLLPGPAVVAQTERDRAGFLGGAPRPARHGGAGPSGGRTNGQGARKCDRGDHQNDDCARHRASVAWIRSTSKRMAITPAPAWTADQLAAPAGDDWISNMGNLSGWRYSSLTQVTPANVANLKLAWKINLGTCLTKDAACGSLEANAVVYKGT